MFPPRCVASSIPSPSRVDDDWEWPPREALDVSSATAFLCRHLRRPFLHHLVQRHQQIYDAEETREANRNNLAGLRAAVRAGTVGAHGDALGFGGRAVGAQLKPGKEDLSGHRQEQPPGVVAAPASPRAERTSPFMPPVGFAGGTRGTGPQIRESCRRLSARTVACCYTHSSLMLSMETLISPVALTVMWAVSLT